MAIIIGRNLLLLSFSWCFLTCPSYSDTDTILQGQEIRDWQHLVSANGVFRLQFFSHGTYYKRYLGISYNIGGSAKVGETEVWIVNRNSPIIGTSGSLMIDSDGNMKISSSGSSPIIINSVQASGNTSATLLDNGNFILRELNSNGSTGQILWQSFDYPTDTLLPGMKLGINFKTGHTWSLTSWRRHNSPASGSFTLGLDPNSTSQLVILWQGDIYWTSGPWHDGHFEYVSMFSYKSKPKFRYFSDENEKYFIYSVDKSITHSRYKISPEGIIEEVGNRTAPFGACSAGLEAGDDQKAGCTKKKLQPECRDPNIQFVFDTGYMSTDAFKFPENDNLSYFDCRDKCISNCSCVAYSWANDDGTGCEIWSQGSVFTGDALRGVYIAHLVPHKGKLS